MNIANLLSRATKLHPDRPALCVGDETVASYAQFERRVASVAGALRNKFGMRPGDRIAIAMTNCPQFLEVQYASWRAGLVLVPTNARLHPKELSFILQHSGARICFATTTIGEAILSHVGAIETLEHVIDVESDEYRKLVNCDPIPVVDVDERQTAWLGYTSGTTGQPKGAMLSHRSLLSTALRHYSMEPVSCYDTKLYAAAMSHGAGAFGLSYVAQGCTQVIPYSRGFDPAEIFTLLESYENLSLFAAPTMVMRLVNHPKCASAKIENLKTVLYGGGPMYVQDLKSAMNAIGNRFHQGYGLTEAPLTVTGLSKRMHGESDHPRYLERLTSVGAPFMGTEIATIDPDGAILPVGEAGEIIVRGDVVMTGYWERPDATAEVLRDGWLHTGDVGVIDEEGFLTLKDRSKDVIISGGLNIYPREIEEVLLTHPDVAEVSVVGTPNREWGEEAIAFVVLKRDVQELKKELDEMCQNNLARFKRPRRYEIVDELPKNNYGKVLKRDLRERLLADLSV